MALPPLKKIVAILQGRRAALSKDRRAKTIRIRHSTIEVARSPYHGPHCPRPNCRQSFDQGRSFAVLRQSKTSALS